MELIEMPHMSGSKAHYSPAVVHNGLVYVSGQLPIAYDQGKSLPEGDITAQTLQALHNLEAVLQAAGSRRELVLKTVVYVPDIGYWPLVNELYARFFGSHRPARSVVPTGELHFGALIEIEAIAVLPQL